MAAPRSTAGPVAGRARAGRQEPAVLGEVARLAGQDSGVAPEALGSFLDDVIEAVRAGRRLGEPELRACREQGAAAARAGVSVGAIVDLYLSSVWRLWPSIPGVIAGKRSRGGSDDALFALRAADDGVAALVGGYDGALRSLVRREAAAQQEVLDDLLAGQMDVAVLAERGAQLGLRLAARHRVAIVRLDRVVDVAALRRGGAPAGGAGPAAPGLATGTGRDLPAADGAPAEATLRAVERAVGAAVGSGDDSLIGAKGGDLVVVLPDRGAFAAAATEADLQTAGLKLLPRRKGMAAVGHSHPGPGGVRASWLEAQEALVVAERLDLPGPVVTAARLSAYRLLLRDIPSLQQLVESVLGPLRGARGGAGPLVETITAFLTSESTAETARRLHLSVRAAAYRLERIEQLTGLSFADATDRYALHSAALGARLLGWS